MVLRVMYAIELLEAEEGGIELVDPSWCPEEGPPRKKVKSPPVISPTGSSTSLYSGGSSSIEWTTTGTSLEMQGTRVTRTQYGFRTLQESSAKMCLKVTGFPLPDITWYKDDVLLKDDQRHTFYSDEDGFFALTIDPVQVDDTGRYTCVATNEYGQASTSAFFRVLKVEKESAEPSFVKSLFDKNCKEGDVVTFDCEVDGWPEPELIWLVDDQPLRPSQDFRLQYDGQHAKLEIRDAQPDDTGTYAVRISNEYGSAVSQSQLTVAPDPDKNHVPPEFQAVIEDAECDEGQTVKFKAVLTGDPEPEVVWYINGVPLTASEKIRFINEDGICLLTIKDVSRHFDGTVTCQGKNRLGSGSCEAQLRVRVPPLPPQFDRPLEDRVITENGAVMFEADIAGYPEPKVYFFLKGRPLLHGQNGVEIRQGDGLFRVTIPNCQMDTHDGEVLARASNEHGQAESRARLTVEPEEEESRSAPTFIKDLEDQTVKYGQSASFDAVVRGSPMPNVSWYLNSQKLDEHTPGVVAIQANGNEHKIVLDSAQWAGTVLCRAENPIGRFETKARLIALPAEKSAVQGTPRAPQFDRKPSTVQVERGEQAVFETHADGGSAMPEYSWTVEGRRVFPSTEGARVEFDEATGVSKLYLDTSKFPESVPVVVSASNNLGSDQCTARLIVVEPLPGPPFKKGRFSDESESTTESQVTQLQNMEKARAGAEGEPMEGVEVQGQPVAVLMNPGEAETGPSKPRFSQELESVNVKEGESLEMTATVSGNPQPTVKWILEEEEVEAMDENVQITSGPGGRQTLRIQKTSTAQHSGRMVLRAENSQGTSESAADVTIQPKPGPPYFSREPQDHEVMDGEESVKFSAIVHGNPEPVVYWYLKGQCLISSENVRVKHDAISGKTSIRLFHPTLEDSGDVKVIAENMHGRAEAGAKLKVEKKSEIPRFLSDMDDRQTNEGGTVKFSARIEAATEVQWTLNGQQMTTTENIKITSEGNLHTLELNNVQIAQAGELACTAKNSAGSKRQNAQLIVKESGVKPTFVRTIEDRLVEEGQTLVMEAQIAPGSKPDPEVRWLKDGNRIQSDEHFKLSEEAGRVHKLVVIRTEQADKGRITLQAENKFGTTECSANVGVQKSRYQKRPEFLSSLDPITVTEGDSLKAKLLISANPKPYIKWFINNQMVAQTEDTEMTDEGGVCKLVIHGCTRDMSGKIKCVAGNKMGEATTEGKLTVVAPVPVEFETALCDATCREGDTLKLKAVLLGEPMPDVTWFINGKKLEESQNIKIHADQGTYTVTIKDITMDYAGLVVCEAVNEFGKASSQATLKVNPRGEPPDFLEWLSNVRARQGSEIHHKVVYTGDPRPVITWFLNGQVVTDSSEISIRTDDTTSVLVIRSFNPEKHVGEIICKAENDAGEVSCTANMATYTSDMFTESESNEEQREELEVERQTLRTPTPIMAPAFITKIKDTRAQRGHQAIFECVVPDTKGVCCKWLKDGKEIELIARIRVQLQTIEGFTTSELVIDEVEPEDAGKYTVVVENIVGTAQCEAELTVVETLDKPIQKAPEFTVKLQDKQVHEMETVSFECKVSGLPEPSISWFRGEERLTEQSERVTLENVKGVQRLTIESVQVAEQGRYSCVAENAAGRADTSAELRVEGQQAPQFTRTLSDQEAQLSGQVVLECSVTGVPQPTVEFQTVHDSFRILTGTRVSIQHDETNTHWRMVIKDVLDNDFRQYRAVAKNTVGQAISECTVRQSEPGIERPRIIEGLKRQRVREAETAEMSVRVAGTGRPGQPPPEVEWFKDGVPLKPDGKKLELVEYREAGEYKLFIHDCHTEDAGDYGVRISNKAGQDSSHAQLAVDIEELQKPEFTQPLKDMSIKVEESVTLATTVVGKPEPEVRWLKDGESAQIDGQHLIRKDEDQGRHSLIINKARLEDAGLYTCKAENKAGEAESRGRLGVQEDVEAPRFTEGLRDVKIKEGDSGTLSATVTGKPEPEVHWYKDGRPVQVDNVHVVQKEGKQGQHSLTVNQANSGDAGQYSCKATNKAGEAQSEAKFGVQEVTEAPRFVEGLKPVEVKEGETGTMSVVVSGRPEPTLEWYKDGYPLNIDGDHIAQVDEGNGRYSLVITDARPKNAGSYTCKAVNKAGQMVTQAKFGVIEDIEAPKFTDGLKPVEVKEGETAKLTTTVAGRPEPKIEWFKDGRPVQIDGDHIVRKDEPDGGHSLVIRDAKPEDAGNYTCKASNKVGQTVSDAKFGVQAEEKPKAPEQAEPMFLRPLEPQTVREGESAEMSCKVNAEESKPEIRWYRDDRPIVPGQEANILIEQRPDGTQTLKIRAATKQDIAMYRCEAVNPVGRAQTSAPLKYAEEMEVDQKFGQAEPMFLRPLEPKTVREGEAAEMSCRVNTEESKPEIRWYRDDKPIVPGQEPNIVIEQLADGTQKLKVLAATKQEIGLYRCEAVNPVGRAQTQAPLKYAEERPIEQPEEEHEAMLAWRRPLQDKQVPKGSRGVVLKCQLEPTALRGVRVDWLKDGAILSNKMEQYKLGVEQRQDGTQRLIFEQAEFDHIGVYRCVATDAGGTQIWTEARLGVIAPRDTEEMAPGPPEFVELLKSCTTTIGGTAVLRCKVKGNPRPTIVWSRQGYGPLTASDRLSMEYHEDGTIILTLKNAEMEDTGEYRCDAENDYGSAWTEGPIIVAAEGSLPTEGEAPDFLEPVRPITVKQGDTGILEGRISGLPFPEVKWYKGENLIVPGANPRYTIEGLPDGTQRLIITNAQMSDMDDYRCEATNKYGDVWSDVTLTVQEREPEEIEEPTAPFFEKGLQEVRANEGEPAELECMVKGWPKPEIKWYKDGDEIGPEDVHFKRTSEPDGTCRLTLPAARITDAGVFRCQATNPSGTARTEAPLRVLLADESPMPTEVAPEFLQHLKPVQAKEGDEAVFECKVAGTPAPDIKWYKDGVPLGPEDGVKIESLPDGTHRLIIPKTRLDDQGNYRCEATNPAGSMSSKAPLSVIPAEIKPKMEETKPAEAEEAMPMEEGAKPGEEMAKMGEEWVEPKPTAEEIPAEGEAREGAKVPAEAEEAPSFRKGLEDQTLPRGSPLVLDVEVEGKPKEVQWSREGSPLDRDSGAIPEDLGNGHYRLSIPDLANDGDFGRYSVKVSNDAGQAESAANVKEAVPAEEKPQIVRGLVPVTVRPGEPAKFEVEAKGPVRSVKWYKNGKEMEGPQTEQDGNCYRLIIPAAGPDDEADYKVVLANNAGEADSSAGLKLIKPITFVRPLEDVTVPKGHRAVLNAETDRAPQIVKWFKNGEEIQPRGAKAQPKFVSDTKFRLEIPDTDEDDTADYKIKVFDREDEPGVECACALTVLLPAEKPAEQPRFEQPLQEQTIPEEDELVLEVKTVGKPHTVRWYKNGNQLSPSDRIRMEKLGPDHFRLVVPSALVDDSGDYAVEIANDAGMARCEARQTVEPFPEFIRPLQDVDVKEGERAEFWCETNLRSVPHTIKWFCNGKEVKADDRHELKVENDGAIFRMVIKSAKKEDAGTVRIEIENTAGKAQNEAKLGVQSAKKEVPKIVKALLDQIVADGEELTFEVQVAGEVDEVRWLKDGQPLAKDARVKMVKVDEQTYRMTIPKAELSDAGEYEVQAINDAGKAVSSAHAEVDQAPRIVQGLLPAEIDEGDEHVFRVEASAPIRTVKWLKNGEEIKAPAGARIRLKDVSPKKYELVIDQAQLDDGANYKVVLANRAGECDSAAQLTVRKPALFQLRKGLQDVTIDEGQPLELVCELDGEPADVKWYKNGDEMKPDERIQIVSNPSTGVYSLRIPRALTSDGGAYRVVFANPRGGEVSSGSVAHVRAKKREPETSPAVFLSPLEDVELPEGESLTLKCKVGGQPMPEEVQWFCNGAELKPDGDRIAIRLGLDGTATMRIRDIRKGEAGQFKATASNEAGKAETSCQVKVLEREPEPMAPKFVIPLRSTEGTPGESAEFTVKVRGVPKPELQWILNGVPIDFARDARFKLEDLADGNWAMTIKDIQESDFGTLRCVATNPHGKDECEAEFGPSAEWLAAKREKEGWPPRFNVPLWDRRVPEGQPLAIECHVDAKPTADIEWFYKGKLLEESDEVEIRNTPDGACRVRIAHFRQEHIGEYVCKAKNEYGTADTRANYNVEVEEAEEVPERKEFAPRFNPGLSDQQLNVGEPLRLFCRVEAEPQATVTFYKDGVPVRSTDRCRVDYDAESGECSLMVEQAEESDAGAYRCVAKNAHGSTNTACQVSVKGRKEEAKKEGAEPQFTRGLVDQYIERGDTLVFTCAVTGDPEPEIKWYCNGKPLKPSDRVSIEQLPGGECRLTIKDCSMTDEGIYRCEATNPHGTAKTQATAHVEVSKKVEKPKLEMGEAPQFVIPLEDLNVFMGSAIEMECKCTGVPMPTVKWSKDGRPLVEDGRFEWDNKPEQGHYRLRIRDATRHDEGTYRCVATNESGQASTKAFVRIDESIETRAPEEETKPPHISVKLKDQRVQEGQPLKLHCKVEGNPTPELVWYKDGEQVRPSDRIQLERDADGNAYLIIPKCTMDDDGVYRVIATNPHGTAYDKCTVTVKKAAAEEGPPAAPEGITEGAKAGPKLLEPLQNVKCPEGTEFVLRCRFSGDPTPTIKWFKDGERLVPYDRMLIPEMTEDGWCELRVPESMRSDSGNYRCIAENPLGSARTTGEVQVQREKKPKEDLAELAKEVGRAPGFTIPLTVKHAKPGETVVFECLPYGKPFPDIKWLKDGIELVPGEGMKIEALPDGIQRLILDNVDFAAEGYYRCVATNEYGTASTRAELTIHGERPLPKKLEEEGPVESKPRIRPGLYSQSIHQGSPVEMQICALGFPTPTVEWLKDGQPIAEAAAAPDSRITIYTDERGAHHLVIVNCQPEDEGDYQVVAKNPLGEAVSTGTLSVIRPRGVEGLEEERPGGMPFPPGFIRQLKNKHVFTKMPTIFDCLVVGYPPPEVDWYHNGKKITPGGRIKIQVGGGGSHALLITDTCIEDAGEYVAIARNEHGTANSSAILDVTAPFLDKIKFDGVEDVTPYLTEEYGFKKAKFKAIPSPPDRGPFIKEVTGHYLTLSWIPTKRSPPRYPQVTYVIEFRELPDKEWSLLDYNIPEPVCKVRNLELGKSYQFRVRAENIYGISDPSPPSPPSRLMAPPPPVLDRNKRVIPLLDPYAERALDRAHAEQYACTPWFAPGVQEKHFVAENDVSSITLHYSGYPDPKIMWKHRGWDIEHGPTSNIRVSTHAGTETTITFLGFSKANAGQYTCMAENQYGKAEQNLLIEIASRPRFIQGLNNRECSSERPMRLDVRIEGNPAPAVKWLKDWRPIVESSRVHLVHEPGLDLRSLVIDQPIWSDSGIYTCMALNDAGQAVTSCTITIEAETDYLKDLKLRELKKSIKMERGPLREIYDIQEADVEEYSVSEASVQNGANGMVAHVQNGS